MSEPLAHLFAPPLPGYPELESEILARKIEQWDANAEHRAEMARNSRMTLAMAFVAVAGLTFLIGYGAAAVVDQGWDNIKSHRTAGLPT